MNVTKLYHRNDYKSFVVLGRIISGTIYKGQSVRVMGENYEVGEEEDVFIRNVAKLHLLQGRFKYEVEKMTAGNLVLIEGIDHSIVKTATIVDAKV